MHTVLCGAQELSKGLRHQQQLQEQLQQRDVAVQQLQNQLYAAVQHMEQLQQQGQAQAMHAYKSAVQLSCDRLQGLKDRYFNSMPTASFTTGKQGSNSVLKLQREGIVSAYTDFQQRRGSITSMHIMPAAGTCSPSSSLRRGYLTAGSQGSFQQPLLHLPSHLDSPGRNVPASSRFMDSRKSFAVPVSRTSSSAAPHRQGNLEQPFASRRGSAASPVSCDDSVLPQQSDGILHAESALPLGQSIAEQTTSFSVPFAGTSGHADSAQSWQQDTASITLHSQQLGGFASALSDIIPASSLASWHMPDVQPESGWSTPLSEQLLQFEGCLLNALTGLLTQKPSASGEHDSARAEAKKRGQGGGARQQVWPRAAEDSQQSAQDTTGTAALHTCISQPDCAMAELLLPHIWGTKHQWGVTTLTAMPSPPMHSNFASSDLVMSSAWHFAQHWPLPGQTSDTRCSRSLVCIVHHYQTLQWLVSIAKWDLCRAGELVRAMSAQKKDLTRRLKAAECSNRQLRSELQDFRAGQRWGATPGPLPTDRSPSAATDRPSSNIRSEITHRAQINHVGHRQTEVWICSSTFQGGFVAAC